MNYLDPNNWTASCKVLDLRKAKSDVDIFIAQNYSTHCTNAKTFAKHYNASGANIPMSIVTAPPHDIILKERGIPQNRLTINNFMLPNHMGIMVPSIDAVDKFKQLFSPPYNGQLQILEDIDGRNTAIIAIDNFKNIHPFTKWGQHDPNAGKSEPSFEDAISALLKTLDETPDEPVLTQPPRPASTLSKSR